MGGQKNQGSLGTGSPPLKGGVATVGFTRAGSRNRDFWGRGGPDPDWQFSNLMRFF